MSSDEKFIAQACARTGPIGGQQVGGPNATVIAEERQIGTRGPNRVLSAGDVAGRAEITKEQ